MHRNHLVEGSFQCICILIRRPRNGGNQGKCTVDFRGSVDLVGSGILDSIPAKVATLSALADHGRRGGQAGDAACSADCDIDAGIVAIVRSYNDVSTYNHRAGGAEADIEAPARVCRDAVIDCVSLQR